ncbi:MAG: rhodanese-like domain-containing protein [Pseudomonadota bacterium]
MSTLLIDESVTGSSQHSDRVAAGPPSLDVYAGQRMNNKRRREPIMIKRMKHACAMVAAAVALTGLLAQSSFAGDASGQFDSRLARCQAAERGSTSEQGAGELPLAIAGATTVSPKVADCLMKAMGDELVVMAAMGEVNGVPKAWPVPYAGMKLTPAQEETLALWVLTITDGSHDRPILVYCHHAKCRLSYSAVQRLLASGHSKVLWMREGIKGWAAAGLPEGSVRIGAGYAAKLYFDARAPGGALESIRRHLSASGRKFPQRIQLALDQCLERRGVRTEPPDPMEIAETLEELLEQAPEGTDISYDDLLSQALPADGFRNAKMVYSECLTEQLDASVMSDPALLSIAIRHFIQSDTLFEDDLNRVISELKANPSRYFRRSGSRRE